MIVQMFKEMPLYGYVGDLKFGLVSTFRVTVGDDGVPELLVGKTLQDIGYVPANSDDNAGLWPDFTQDYAAAEVEVEARNE